MDEEDIRKKKIAKTKKMFNLIDSILESEKKEQKKLLSSFIEWLYREGSLALIKSAATKLFEFSYKIFKEYIGNKYEGNSIKELSSFYESNTLLAIFISKLRYKPLKKKIFEEERVLWSIMLLNWSILHFRKRLSLRIAKCIGLRLNKETNLHDMKVFMGHIDDYSTPKIFKKIVSKLNTDIYKKRILNDRDFVALTFSINHILKANKRKGRNLLNELSVKRVHEETDPENLAFVIKVIWEVDRLSARRLLREIDESLIEKVGEELVRINPELSLNKIRRN